MLSDDKIKMMDVNGMVDDLRLELLQSDMYDDDELEQKIELLEQILDLCSEYLGL